jgi:hypothetical protein
MFLLAATEASLMELLLLRKQHVAQGLPFVAFTRIMTVTLYFFSLQPRHRSST